MKFSLVTIALLVAGAVGVRYVLQQRTKATSGPVLAPVDTSKVGPAYQRDPFATLEDQSQPLDSISNDPITEAAYHQGPVVMTGAFGADENTGGEEVYSII